VRCSVDEVDFKEDDTGAAGGVHEVGAGGEIEQQGGVVRIGGEVEGPDLFAAAARSDEADGLLAGEIVAFQKGPYSAQNDDQRLARLP
jgi:hypothetical protein